MFVGHLALALAAKTKARTVSLGWLVAAGLGLDLLWPILLLTGIERAHGVVGATPFNPLVFDAYPWSHSLVLALVWSGLAFTAARWRGLTASTAALLGALVTSHWVLDYLTHAPDLPLWPGESPRLGLGLWYSIPATVAVEGALLLGGTALYVRATRPLDRAGSVGLWLLLALSAAMWLAGPWSPPPPNQQTLGWFGLGTWLLAGWAGWADRHRIARVTAR